MNISSFLCLFIFLCLISQITAVNVTIQVSGPNMNKAGCACGNFPCSVNVGSEVTANYNEITTNVNPFLLIRLTNGGFSCQYSIQFSYNLSTNTLGYWNGNDSYSACSQIGGTMAKQNWQCHDGYNVLTINQ